MAYCKPSYVNVFEMALSFMVQPISDVLDLKPLTRIYEQGQLSHKVEIARVTHSSAPRNSGILHTDRLTILRTLMNRYPSPINSAHSPSPRQDSSRSPSSRNFLKLPRIHRIGISFLGVFPFHAAGYGRATSPNQKHHELCHFVLRRKPHNSESCKKQANDTGLLPF